MLRSWGSRADTVVVDEPLYAYYLDRTGLDHPGRDEVLASQPREWEPVAEALTAPLPAGKTISYQKHMSHHLLDEVGRDWLDGLTHAFLIRDPAAMLGSLDEKLEQIGLADTGLPQQVELFRRCSDRLGHAPPVIDSRDVLADPPAALGRLCEALGVPFDPAMLAWEPGIRDTDGVWAPHWYENVAASTGFGPYRPPRREVPDVLRPVLDDCRPLYDELAAHRLGA